MCGIVAVFDDAAAGDVESRCRASLAILAHRGPDGAGVELVPGVGALGHRRLAIMDPDHGHQPIHGPGGSVLVHNGEIYNWRQLRRDLEQRGRTFTTGSDSEVIAQLYEEYGATCARLLDGDFAFAVTHGGDWLVARDPLGVKPLYYGRDAGGRLWFASEFKALEGRGIAFQPFPPGHLYTRHGGLTRYFTPSWRTHAGRRPADPTLLRRRFTTAVDKRLMSDVPLGVLLSGGLDSSLVASVAARCARTRSPERRLPSFSVGVDTEAPDLRSARAVAAHIGTDHHETVFDIEEGIARLPEIIRHLESYDLSLVRGSVPMYFMMRDVRRHGVKSVLSGDGSDEAFGGYLYLYAAPDTAAFAEEIVAMIEGIHLIDLPTVDKLSMQHGIEARVPFMDTDLLDFVMDVDPELKRPLPNVAGRPGRIEKWLLRAAFDDPADPYLPGSVLWRQKEAFEDGVGYTWIDALREHAQRSVSDAELAEAGERFPHQTPRTKEAFLYREIFSRDFPSSDAAACVGWWTTRWEANDDPSGRAATMHAVEVAGPDQFVRVIADAVDGGQ